MHPRDLNRAQLELECIGVDEGGRLYRTPGNDPDDIHLVFLVRYADEIELLVMHDAEPALVRELGRQSPRELWTQPESLAQLLYGSPTPSDRWWRGRACYFAAAYSPELFPLVRKSGDAFVVLADGREVSRAESSRRNHRCAELGTETDEPYRRRGFATQVCRAWANEQLIGGRISFYSYSPYERRLSCVGREAERDALYGLRKLLVMERETANSPQHTTAARCARLQRVSGRSRCADRY